VPSTSFIAVTFASVADAEAALAGARELDVTPRDAAVVVRTEAGRIELQQAHELAAGEALVGGGSAGLIAGLLLGLPVGGALLGLAGGLAYGIRDRGLPDSRMRQLGQDLQPGHAILCVLVDDAVLADAREALSRYGTVFDVKLSAGSSDAGAGSEP
jgi:uncharacterized membrane protein